MAALARRIKPLFDRVVVEKVIPEVKTKSGILLPDAVAPATNEAIVLSVGTGVRTADGKVLPLVVKEGDRVLLPDFGGTKVTLENKEFYIYREADFLGVLSA